jgi:hypothetical protein
MRCIWNVRIVMAQYARGLWASNRPARWHRSPRWAPTPDWSRTCQRRAWFLWMGRWISITLMQSPTRIILSTTALQQSRDPLTITQQVPSGQHPVPDGQQVSPSGQHSDASQFLWFPQQTDPSEAQLPSGQHRSCGGPQDVPPLQQVNPARAQVLLELSNDQDHDGLSWWIIISHIYPT